MHIEVQIASGIEGNNVPTTCLDRNSRLPETNLSSLVWSQTDHKAARGIPTILMTCSGDIDIEDEPCERPHLSDILERHNVNQGLNLSK